MHPRVRFAVSGAVVALVAAVALLGDSPGAIATHAGAVQLGHENSASGFTTIYNTTSGFTGCTPGAGSVAGFVACGAIGVEGKGRTAGGISGTGVEGVGNVYGVRGTISISALSGGIGVEGHALGGGTGVLGRHSGTTGIGVQGETGGVGAGVYGLATANGAGVFGDTTDGTGVQARSTNGNALRVLGKAQFSRSGRVTIPTGSTSVVVPGVALTGSSMVLATVQNVRANTWMRAAVPNASASTITIYLNKQAPQDTKVAWLVIEQP